jgi:hypothetical protein
MNRSNLAARGVRRDDLLCVMTSGLPRSDRANPTSPPPSRFTVGTLEQTVRLVTPGSYATLTVKFSWSVAPTWSVTCRVNW